MSIIMDALKKAQNINKFANNNAPAVNNPVQVSLNTVAAVKKNFRPKFVFGLLAVTALIFILLFVVFRPKPAAAPKPKTISPEELIKQIKEQESVLSKPQAKITEKKPLSALILKGIVIGGGDNYAIIGERIVKQGQEIEGALVKEIKVDEVILSSEGKDYIIKLNQ